MHQIKIPKVLIVREHCSAHKKPLPKNDEQKMYYQRDFFLGFCYKRVNVELHPFFEN